MFGGFGLDWVGCVGVARLKNWLFMGLVVSHSWLALNIDLIVIETIAQKYHFCALNVIETLLLLRNFYIVICFFERADGSPSIDIPDVLIVVLNKTLILLGPSLELVYVLVIGATWTIS